jgi:hypothetical protein
VIVPTFVRENVLGKVTELTGVLPLVTVPIVVVSWNAVVPA